nr:insulinase family protein [Deltaproteobacteria bacterium]
MHVWKKQAASLSFFLLFLLGLLGPAVALEDTVKLNVKEFSLNNGMQFLVVERPVTPQIACRVSIRAGSALEEQGKTGIAHLIEHMMFKGTKNFGTTDPERDEALRKKIDDAYQVVAAERRKREPDKSLIDKKLAEMESLRTEVQQLYVPQAFSSQLGKNGAVGINAFTSHDETQYVMSIPSDMLEQWFSIVSEQLFEPAWREFYVEKEVVQREWAYRYINSPEGAAWLDLYATAYTAHPYRNPVIGWRSDMDAYSIADAVIYHAKHYNPTNAVCVLVGDLTVAEAKRLASIYFERYPAGQRSTELVTQEPEQEGPRRSVRYVKGAVTPLVRISYHGTRMGTKDFYALDALSMALSAGRSARMAQNLVNRGKAIEAWAANPDGRYESMFILGGSPNERSSSAGKQLSTDAMKAGYLESCEALEALLLKEVEVLKNELISPRELERIKKLNQRDFLDSMRSNETLASRLATLEVEVGWRYLDTYLAAMAAITPEDIRQAAQRYLDQENRTTVFIIPGGIPEKPAETYTEVRTVSGAAAATMATKADTTVNRSQYPTPAGWKHPMSFERKPEKIFFPAAEKIELEGATVFYLPDHELPLVDLTLLIKAGGVDVPEDKIGLASTLSGSIVRGGTKQHDPTEFALVLDENAIQLSFSAAEEETAISLSVLNGDWQRGLDLLEQVLTKPRFDPEILNAVKMQELTDLKRQSDNASAVAMREAEIWRFKGHPYGRDPLQGLETIPTITREDLEAFLKRYCVPSNMVVAVSGDLDKAEIIKGLQKLLASLPDGSKAERTLPQPADTPPVLALINKPGQSQSQVSLTLPGVLRTQPEYWKLSLLMNVFGGEDSLMYKRLREDLGLVYATWFFQTYKWKAGILAGYIGCKGDQTKLALEETIKVMESLRQNVPSEELERQRLNALNSFVFNVDTPAALVNVYAHYQLRNEPLNTLELIQDAFTSATAEELTMLSNRYLDPRNLQIFVVGDKNIGAKRSNGSMGVLGDDLQDLAATLGLQFKEVPLR